MFVRPRSLAAIAALVMGTTFGVGSAPAGAVSCSGSSSPPVPQLSLAQTVVPAATSGGNVGYQETVTNTGSCGATGVEVDVTLPAAAGYAGFASGNRSWSCPASADATNTVACLLTSQLDQRSTGSTTGNSGTATVTVYATQVSGGNKSQPPDVGEFAQLSDNGQQALFLNTRVWGGSINAKTGGTVSITQIETTINGETVTVTVPSGAGGAVNLLQRLADTGCPSGYNSVTGGCTADLGLSAPHVSNGFNTIEFDIVGPSTLPNPLYDEEDGNGPQAMQKCKGQTAFPPCWYSIKETSTAPPTWVVIVHDSGGTKLFP
jgi:hypothetical protein